MIMDVGRRCTATLQRSYVDALNEVQVIIWQWCAPGAKPLPYQHKFGLALYDYFKEEQDTGAIGEIRGRFPEFIDGDLLPKAPGICWVGEPGAWSYGAQVHEDGEEIPPCCLPNLFQFKASGGAKLSGTAPFHPQPVLMPSGGTKLSGSADAVVHLQAVAGGILLRATGTSSAALTLLQADNGRAVFGGSAEVLFTPAEEANEASISANESMPVVIPDNDPSGINLTFDVSGKPGSWRLISLSISITHPNTSDLTFTLTSPSMISYDIGQYSPLMIISLFNENINGQWNLNVADRFAINNGQVNNAALIFGIAQQFAALAVVRANIFGGALYSFTPYEPPGGGVSTTCCSSVPTELIMTLSHSMEEVVLVHDSGADWYGTSATPGGVLQWHLSCDATTWTLVAIDVDTLVQVFEASWTTGNYGCSPTTMDYVDAVIVQNDLSDYYGEPTEPSI